MSIQLVNLGDYPNDGSGDDLRTAFIKTNSNITELDNIKVESAVNIGTGAPTFLDKQGNDLRFRSLKAGPGDSGDYNIAISYDSDHITLTVVDSLQAVKDDLAPQLGGNLDLNNFNVTGIGNITVNGDISSNNLFGDLTGNVTGNVLGDVTGNLFGDVIGNLFGDVTGNVLGNVTGNLFGDVTGQVSDISNHVLSDLNNVSTSIPAIGQALVWSGINWAPQSITTGVSKIVAGSNITISPTDGLGEVTINATGTSGGGGNIDFGTFSSPSDFSLDFGSF